ncbi:hypothetical protein KUTeg_020385 [Tegillarca granosa]|uniref:Uncharacterized protein n=1 Tax=Tegillarca granosa TaxID=220873 RepID=A0ABQ9E7Q2_TEGGR|nr:hypothetical protein KUTeg_020385 [Tegillarca granosa]
MENVAGLLCGACQFGLEDLTTACWDFIDRCIQANNIHQILVAARQYSQHRIITILLNKINQKIASLKERSKLKSCDTACEYSFKVDVRRRQSGKVQDTVVQAGSSAPRSTPR